ncbi:hypothetical protein SHO565_52760 [Streptomyces sp. HO565]
MSSSPASAAAVIGAVVGADRAAGAVDRSGDFRMCLVNMAMLRLERQKRAFPPARADIEHQ